MSDGYVRVARVDEIAPGSAATVLVGDREIALFNVAGTFYALENTCPHQGGPLAEGWIDDESVTCPWHAWTFRLRDGSMTLGDYCTVDTFDVRVVDGDVWVSAAAREREPKGADAS